MRTGERLADLCTKIHTRFFITFRPTDPGGKKKSQEQLDGSGYVILIPGFALI